MSKHNTDEKELFLCAVGLRANQEKDWEYVEILDVQGKMLKGELRRLRGENSDRMGLEDFVSHAHSVLSLPKSYRGGFLPCGLWVLEGVPKVTVRLDNRHSPGIPQVVFDDTKPIKWRRPRESDQWPKRLRLGRF